MELDFSREWRVIGPRDLDLGTDRETAATSVALLSPAQAMRHLPTFMADEHDAALVAMGRPLTPSGREGSEGSSVAVLAASGALLAVYRVLGDRLVASVVLAAG